MLIETQGIFKTRLSLIAHLVSLLNQNEHTKLSLHVFLLIPISCFGFSKDPESRISSVGRTCDTKHSSGYRFSCLASCWMLNQLLTCQCIQHTLQENCYAESDRSQKQAEVCVDNNCYIKYQYQSQRL